MGAFAWVTLATNDSYSLGALVLAHSLRRAGTQHDLVILITPGVTQSMREKLAELFNVVKEVDVLNSNDETNLSVLQRPELGITFTKLHCWRLLQYEKCVFIDADALVVQNCDELFEREELSAAPDVGWPDCFNSGVFVFKPSLETFAAIATFAVSQGSFDGADQGLLNMYFSDWAHKDISKHLPFIYNMCSTATYSYAPAFKQFAANVRIIHFIGNTKPWLQYFDTMTGIVQIPPGCDHLQPLMQMWWNIFCENVHPQLSDVMATSNMTSIWHYVDPLPSQSRTSKYSNYLHDIDSDMCNEVSPALPDFSEFKDPWENYSNPTMVSVSHDVKQHSSDDQYYHDESTKSSEENQFEIHDQCKRGSISFQSLNLPQEGNDDSRSLVFAISSQTPRTSKQETDRYLADELPSSSDQQSSPSVNKSNILSRNICQTSAFSDFAKEVCGETKDHNSCDFSTPLFCHSVNNKQNHHDRNHNQSSEQTDFRIPDSLINPLPCNDPNNVATQPKLSAASCVETINGGLAGALSRLTMGEARTEEQRAVEDHVRKQNWEQGQIDFMGRDSFDNILRKINETLASAPPRQQSPVKETRQPKKSSRKSSEMETAVEEGEATLPVLDTEDESKTILAQEITEDARQRISESISYPTNTDKELAERLSTIIASEVDETRNEKISTMDKSVHESLEKLVTTLKSIDTSETTMQEGLMEPQVILGVKQTEKQSEVSPAITTETFEGPLPTTQEKKTQIVSEATTGCPVPVQVAESVLQAQPKETVSEDAIPVTEAIASSIIPSVQESAVSVSEAEAVIQLDECALSDKVILSQPLNDNDTFLEPREEKTLTSSEVNGVLAAHDLGNKTPNLKTTLTEQKESQSHVGTVELGTTPLDCASPNEEVPSLQKLELKIDLQSTKTIGEEGETQVLEEEQKPALESEILSEIGSTTTDSLVETNVEPPVRPSRSKDLKIPDTPIIIGPTPPTSPPLDTDAIVALEESSQKQIQPETVDWSTDSESQLKESASSTDVQGQNRGGSEQVQVESVQLPEKGETEKKSKKIAKKSSAESDTPSSPESEGSGKKIVKKVVKKVSKKTKEGTEDDEGSSGHKLKKTAKTEKKLTKTASTSLEADTDVPETPPPPSSSTEPPVPPKRKSKVSSNIKKTD